MSFQLLIQIEISFCEFHFQQFICNIIASFVNCNGTKSNIIFATTVTDTGNINSFCFVSSDFAIITVYIFIKIFRKITSLILWIQAFITKIYCNYLFNCIKSMAWISLPRLQCTNNTKLIYRFMIFLACVFICSIQNNLLQICISIRISTVAPVFSISFPLFFICPSLCMVFGIRLATFYYNWNW